MDYKEFILPFQKINYFELSANDFIELLLEPNWVDLLKFKDNPFYNKNDLHDAFLNPIDVIVFDRKVFISPKKILIENPKEYHAILKLME